MNKVKIKSISKDFFLNPVASVFVTAILQLIIYPMLAQLMDSNSYGVLLTLMGLANTFAMTIGSSLNNTKLLLHAEYEDKDYEGDYLPILLFSNLISIIILIVILQGFHCSQLTNVILVMYMAANAVRSYGSVAYRIRINYVKNLVCCIFVGIGDLCGLGIFSLCKELAYLWPVSFLFGEICAIVYICFSSNIFREPFAVTSFFTRTIKKNAVLMATTLTANLLIYLDRLLLLPILGGEAVTTYTVASVFGKSIGILMGPLTGVLLSYFSQRDFKMNRSGYWKFSAFNVIVALLFILTSHIMAGWFTGIFYPTEIEEARLYLDLANGAAIVSVLSSMTGTTVLKYAPSYWLIIIQAVYVVLYLCGGLLVVGTFGLLGFSYVALLAACVKTIIQLVVGDRYVRASNTVMK